MKRQSQLWALLLLLILGACAEEDPKTTIVSRVKEASKLSTVEFVMTKVVIGQQDKKLLFVQLSESTFLAHTEATLKLGVDLSQLKAEDVLVEGGSVSVTLPPVEVINFSYPAESFKVDDQFTDEQSFNQFEPSRIDEIYQLAELDIRSKINYLPLRKTTEDKTRLFISGLLKAAGYKNVTVSFHPTDDPLLFVPQGDVEKDENESTDS